MATSGLAHALRSDQLNIADTEKWPQLKPGPILFFLLFFSYFFSSLFITFSPLVESWKTLLVLQVMSKLIHYLDL